MSTASSRAHQPDVVTVTTARRSHSEDIDLRERRYVAMQMLRVVCVVLGVVVPAAVWVRLLLFSGAVFLPWFGVVMANAGPTVEKQRPTAVVAHGSLEERVERIAIEPGRVVDAEQ
ncbi:MAG: hypothetical protein JWN17_96 [Frankiales bacterium]|nr:hypothetical protein [Frankiales bacterium]